MARRSHRYADMISLDKIFKAIETAFGFSKEDILGYNRKQPLATIRQIAVYLARNGRTYIQLSEIFKRHHACMVYSFYAIRDRLSYNEYEVEELIKKIEEAL